MTKWATAIQFMDPSETLSLSNWGSISLSCSLCFYCLLGLSFSLFAVGPNWVGEHCRHHLANSFYFSMFPLILRSVLHFLICFLHWFWSLFGFSSAFSQRYTSLWVSIWRSSCRLGIFLCPSGELILRICIASPTWTLIVPSICYW